MDAKVVNWIAQSQKGQIGGVYTRQDCCTVGYFRISLMTTSLPDACQQHEKRFKEYVSYSGDCIQLLGTANTEAIRWGLDTVYP